MNERKSLQKININEIEKRKIFQHRNNMQLNKFSLLNIKNKNGITLIALVISIIVMLILAGVSLNATIGDNGIITQAQNATYMQSIANLEEYLQNEYVKYYDETENYTSKIELLSSKLGNLCLKDGTKNYITYDGKIYYLINKQALRDEVKNQLKGGDTTEYLKYIRLQDVYGVTPDLKVYYCKSGTDSVLGTLDNTELDPSTPLKKINQDAEMKSAITEALSDIGVTVGEDGITVGDATKLKNIELDGSKYNITSISGLSELSSLKTITLSNLNLNDLDGLQNCTLLYYVYFKNCKINDYSKLATVLDLQCLYLYLPSSMSETDANAQVVNLGNGFANATEMNKLEYFGISGNTDMFDGLYTSTAGSDRSKWNYNSSKKSNLTDISAIDKFSTEIKNSIKYVYLNNNSFTSIASLKDFNNIYELDVMSCSNLINLDGLENHAKIVYLFAQRCNLQNINGLSGTTELSGLSIEVNRNLSSLGGLESAQKIDHIEASNCNIKDISALQNNIKLRYLSLGNNINLQSIIALKNCTGIKKLYLGGNINMIGTEVRDALADAETHILQNCGNDYSIPSKYNMYFSTLSSYDYSNLGLTDDSDEINSLKNKTTVTRLNLSGNPNLSNSKLQEILSTMTGLNYLSLKGLKLENLNFLENVKYLIELDIRDCNYLESDLSTLNVNSSKIQTFILNNSNVDLSKIQNAINNISSNRSDSALNNSWVTPEPWNLRGFITIGDNFNYTKCTEITKFAVDAEIFGNIGNVDLSKCSKLEFVHLGYGLGDVKLSSSLESAEIKNTTKNIDLSLCSNLKKLKFINNSTKIGSSANIIKTLPAENNIQELSVTRVEFEDLSCFKNKNFKNLERLSLVGLGNTVSVGNTGCLKNLSGIESATNLKVLNVDNTETENLEPLSSISTLQELYASDTSKLTSLNGIENNSNMNTISISSSGLYNIDSLKQLSNMTYLTLNKCKITDISSLENLKQIVNLDLSENNISNLKPLEKIITNGKTTCSSLILSNNIIQTTAFDGHNNIEILENLYKAGLRKLDVSGNNFTSGSTDKLKSLKWTSYKE